MSFYHGENNTGIISSELLKLRIILLSVPPLGRVKVPFTWSKSLKQTSKTSVVVRSWESCFLLAWVPVVRRRERPVLAAPEPETESPASRGSGSGHPESLSCRSQSQEGGRKFGGKYLHIGWWGLWLAGDGEKWMVLWRNHHEQDIMQLENFVWKMKVTIPIILQLMLSGKIWF